MDKRLEVNDLNFNRTVDEICCFINGTVEQSGSNGVVLGLSGGVDSGVTTALCARALGGEKVLGVLMPSPFTPVQDMDDAERLAASLGVNTIRITIGDITESFLEKLDSIEEKRRAEGNLRARIRMVILYYQANTRNYLVAGTSDRSEILIGFFTKYGDGGTDFLPIGHLYKTQVRQMARHLGIPERIADKPSTPQLYPGHRLLDELPLDYEHLDPILMRLFDENLSPIDVSLITDTPLRIVEDVLRRFKASDHKRSPPPKLNPKRARASQT